MWTTGFPYQGVDVSHYQGQIDWPRVASEHVDFAYIKATEGATLVDPMFSYNWSETKRAGIERGAYHYYSLGVSATDQFSNLAAAVQPDATALPVAVDLEFSGNSPLRPPKSQVSADLSTFCAKIKLVYGKNPIIYASYAFYNAYLTDLPLPHVWIPDYVVPPRGFAAENWDVWQFSEKGTIRGINGMVDLNVARLDPASMK